MATLSFKHIFLSGVCFFGLFLGVYWLFERLLFVPTIYLYLHGSIDLFDTGSFTANEPEKIINLVIVVQGCWIISQYLYFKKILHLEIE